MKLRESWEWETPDSRAISDSSKVRRARVFSFRVRLQKTQSCRTVQDIQTRTGTISSVCMFSFSHLFILFLTLCSVFSSWTDSLLEDLQLSVLHSPQPPPPPHRSSASSSFRSSNRSSSSRTTSVSSTSNMSTLSPAGSFSRLHAGPTFKTSTSSTSYEVSRKYTEHSARRAQSATGSGYGSEPDGGYSGRSTPRSTTNAPVLSDLDNILDDLKTCACGASQERIGGGYSSQERIGGYASLSRERLEHSREQRLELSKTSSYASSLHVPPRTSSPYTNGYGREESPLIDRNSAGSVSKLVADLEADLRAASTDSLPRWKVGKEIKPITTTTLIEEKHNTYEVRPQPIIQTSIQPTTESRPASRRSAKVEELAHRVVEIPKGMCCVCHKDIFGTVVTALGKSWHLECFTCANCGLELGKENFFARDEQPYCEGCYHKLFSPKCALCHDPIIDKCVSALDKTWHPEHFCCCVCGKVIGEEGYYEMDGKAYCRLDYLDLFAPKCAGCNNPITDNFISALDAQWHPDCFVCYDCRCPFTSGSFFDIDGKPYCETHYHIRRGSLCAGCHQPIMGRCITAMFRKFHPEHFVCSFCLKQLNQGTFKEQNDKPYCHGCFDKLFSWFIHTTKFPELDIVDCRYTKFCPVFFFVSKCSLHSSLFPLSLN